MKKKVVKSIILAMAMSAVFSGCSFNKKSTENTEKEVSEQITSETGTSEDGKEPTEEEATTEVRGEGKPESETLPASEQEASENPNIGAKPLEVLESTEITLEKGEVGVIR